MWYLDGVFTPDGSDAAGQFVALASTLTLAAVEKDPPKGTWVLLKDDNPGSSGIHALVLSLQDGRLLMRMVARREAVAWLVANVK